MSGLAKLRWEKRQRKCLLHHQKSQQADVQRPLSLKLRTASKCACSGCPAPITDVPLVQTPRATSVLYVSITVIYRSIRHERLVSYRSKCELSVRAKKNADLRLIICQVLNHNFG
jgi:hypothetical protein